MHRVASQLNTPIYERMSGSRKGTPLLYTNESDRPVDMVEHQQVDILD